MKYQIFIYCRMVKNVPRARSTLCGTIDVRQTRQNQQTSS